MNNMPTSPNALAAPTTNTTLLSERLVRQVIKGSRRSPRRRILLPLHKGPESNLHRMINGLQPFSYIQPHRHLYPPKAESVIVLRGAILNFIFNEDGKVLEAHTLAAGSADFGVDSEPGTFHTFLALEEDTVLFEVKPGPYKQSSDKDFAPWAPAEGTPGAADYMDYLYSFKKEIPS